MKPSREATLGEVLEHISLADIGRAMKGWIALVGCLGLLAIVGIALTKVGSVAAPSFHIPAFIWEGALVAMYCLMMTESRSYHVFHIEFWFPQLRWFGVPLMTGYIVGLIEIGKAFGLWAGYAALVPGLLFLSLCQQGHAKLMAARELADANG